MHNLQWWHWPFVNKIHFIAACLSGEWSYFKKSTKGGLKLYRKGFDISFSSGGSESMRYLLLRFCIVRYYCLVILKHFDMFIISTIFDYDTMNIKKTINVNRRENSHLLIIIGILLSYLAVIAGEKVCDVYSFKKELV